MYSNEKPPLPSISIVVDRPSLFCLNHKRTQRECDARNLERDKQNAQAWEDFRNKLAAWKSSY